MTFGSGARRALYAFLATLLACSAAACSASPEPVRTPGGEAAPADFWGETADIPAAQNVLTVKVLNRTNGKYPDDKVFWRFNDQVHSIAEQQYLDMPANSSGRMYFHLGSPDSPYNDFIEFTVGPDVFHGNTTRVDAFALKLAMRLRSHDGYDVEVGEDRATFAESREATFQRFADAVPEPFKDLARVEAPHRIVAPRTAPAFQPGGAAEDYFTAYAAKHGVKATTAEVVGCAGPLAEKAALCAALNRHVAGKPEATQLDPASYYKAAPANHYARFWHENSLGGLSYGFPYDDHANQSSFVSHGSPQWLLVAVGW
ncbi:glycoside hydrolase family 64 protein [Actinocorallia sp. API 0066]|uniref:glycoside hydrolase family 64 protein n=1 Tax=Actinocorallia sp. API 0066 TaxID=2896846 RepID=UPI001E5D4E02|nr:glycoside hydrolase family 64 protein [Actinocorallia sp. API 0066]MCD0452662.1 glycoside hydrolase family 64 protein [Actinocorallia sp. API 0066]